LTTRLRQLLAALAVDPAALARFLADPEGVMAEAGLAPEEREPLQAERGAGPAGGSLVVAGTGIRSAGQLTVEAIAHIRSAERVFYLVAEPVAEEIVRGLSPERAESLADLYGEGKPRRQTYREMVERILASVREGRRTCAVFYGHPGVFVDPAHRAVREARAAGFAARMLPGVSAEDCLFADLGIDPAAAGCQSYEATDFLVNGRRVDPSSALVLWQVGVLGDPSFSLEVRQSSPLDLLLRRLASTYAGDHQVCVYEAAVLPGREPAIHWLPLAGIERQHLSIVSTLYVPPTEPPRFDLVLYHALRGGG
jgi:uncharacterized protein YabN with tetrapyrrole methylase and pyrophosphatase domain